ncbi:type IV pili methyl-accepting chemotaxis transducer N-terminal domain-containing protein [Aureispira anguillae]|uniref:Type IV pili methyl-accepting chemotaxis transducer N-terminal domain-containing protein n=1 Tax=Aureispira anguillae TaxID=2864201 RepID=A0A915YI08_9BACT|nr:type IV pili methyl-accepting chemotaxis transducer N-terminal domain-containing protein [Aureispira anguillae]BDS13544.1 type IV pili methyl-accepting chemotaxis transducer N-terminal domain-containing protein [Aureispira anguillae]
MYLRILILFLSLITSSKLFAAEGLTIREAINKTVRQQALTQRIAKVYLALNNNLYEPKFYQERDAAIELFQSQLDELKMYTPTDKIKAALKHVRVLWKDYKAVADWSINEEGAIKLLKLCDEMLFASHQLFLSYEEYAREIHKEYFSTDEMLTIIELMKSTGLQRMLTQRVILFHLAVKQDIDAVSSQHKLDHAIENYQKTLSSLENAEINSHPIKKQLVEMKKDWSELFGFLGNFKNNAEQIDQMMHLADGLSQNADQISTLYEDLGVKLSISKSINVSAYQNMLTQRIAKSYVAMTYGYSIAKHKRELLACIDLFEEQMKSMTRSSNATEDLKAAVGVVKTMWKNYRNLVTTWNKMDELTVMKVLEKGHVMMAACDQVAQEIERYAQTIPDYKAFFVNEDGELINKKENIAHQMRLAGMQRAYAQRIAIYFIMNSLSIDMHLSKQRMQNTITDYKANFKMMSSSSINTPEINTELKVSQRKWDKIEQYCHSTQKEDITNVLELCSTLFTQLDRLNTLYEKHMDTLFMEKE